MSSTLPSTIDDNKCPNDFKILLLIRKLSAYINPHNMIGINNAIQSNPNRSSSESMLLLLLLSVVRSNVAGVLLECCYCSHHLRFSAAAVAATTFQMVNLQICLKVWIDRLMDRWKYEWIDR